MRRWVFFYKQKTAYEMRISDWSSDVCSSDLPPPRRGRPMGVWGGSRRTAMRQTSKRRASREDGGAKPPAPRASLYEDVTRRIIAELEAGRDRKSVVSGKSVSVRVDLGGRRIIKKKIDCTMLILYPIHKNYIY